jgi:hypothetical protein
VKLRDHAKAIGLEVGCSDSGCIWGSQGGMCTNGGCDCLQGSPRTNQRETLKLARVAQRLAAEVEHWQGIAKQRRERADTEIELMADIVAAARWHRHGYGKDPKKLLHDAVDAYEKEVNRG